MPVKGLRRQAGLSLYRWVTAKLLQRRQPDVESPSSRPRQRRRESESGNEEAPETSSEKKFSPRSSLGKRSEDFPVDDEYEIKESLDSRFGECNVVNDSYGGGPSEVPSKNYRNDATKGLFLDCEFPGVGSSSGESSMYEEPVPRFESRSLRDRFDSFDSSLPSIYALSKVSSRKDSGGRRYEVSFTRNSVGGGRRHVPSDQDTNCSESFSYDDFEFSRRERSFQVEAESEEYVSGNKDEFPFRPSVVCRHHGSNFSLSFCRSSKMDRGREVSIRAGFHRDDRVPFSPLVRSSCSERISPNASRHDSSHSCTTANLEVYLTKEREREQESRNRGGSVPLVVEMRENYQDLRQRRISIGVLYGKEFREIRHRVRERLLCILKERRGSSKTKKMRNREDDKRRCYQRRRRERKGEKDVTRGRVRILKESKESVPVKNNSYEECPRIERGTRPQDTDLERRRRRRRPRFAKDDADKGERGRSCFSFTPRLGSFPSLSSSSSSYSDGGNSYVVSSTPSRLSGSRGDRLKRGFPPTRSPASKITMTAGSTPSFLGNSFSLTPLEGGRVGKKSPSAWDCCCVWFSSLKRKLVTLRNRKRKRERRKKRRRRKRR